MVRLLLHIALMCLALVVFTREVAVQERPEPPDVFLSYSAPSRLTLHEPVSVAVHVQNSSGEDVVADLGKDSFGYSQLTLQKPDGSSVKVDPKKPTKPDEAYFSGRIQLGSGQRYTKETVLDQWFDFSQEGLYRLRIDFEGTVRSASGQVINVSRVTTMVIRILPRSEKALRDTSDRLVRQMQAVSAEEAILAARKLSFVRDPIAVDYIRQALDNPGRRELDGIAILGLERIGTDDAREALVHALGSQEPSTSRAALAALDRLNAKRK
jgi:hypothetical protein